MDDKNLSVSLITVNYNGEKYLAGLFDSILKLDYPKDKLEVIMVDNNSSDDSIKSVGDNFSWVRIIRNNVNNYSIANNVGIKSAKGEFVALINNDLTLDKDWLIELIKVIGRDSGIGAVSGKILFPGGKLQSTGHHELPHLYWADRGFKEDDKGQYDVTSEVSSLSHCATLYRKECIVTIGPIDEDFNLYMEDVDMSIRATQKGWRLFYVPQAIAYHEFHGSADENLVSFYCERNRLLLIAKHFPMKLADELHGRGYFTILNNREKLLEVLPQAINKLIKHHSPEEIIHVFPGIIENLNKILHQEKHYLVTQVDSSKEIIAQKDRLIFEKEEEISLKNRIIRQKEEESAERSRLIRLKEEELSQKNEVIFKKKEELSQKEEELLQKNTEICALKEEIHQIYTSETYRFVTRPIVKILGIIKFLKIKLRVKQKRILIIKPRCVGIEATEKAIKYARESNLDSHITLAAGLSKEDSIKLIAHNNIDTYISYLQGREKLTVIGILRLFFKLKKDRFDEAVIPVADTVAGGYRNSRLLAFFSGAGKVRFYFAWSGRMESLYPFISLRGLCSSIYRSIVLIIILILFYIFIIIPLQLKRFFRK